MSGVQFGQFGDELMFAADDTRLISTPIDVYTTALVPATLVTSLTDATGVANPINTNGQGNLKFFAAPAQYLLYSGGLAGLFLGLVIIDLPPGSTTGSSVTTNPTDPIFGGVVGSDWSPAIAAAIATLGSTGTLEFPKGQFHISQHHVVPDSCSHIGQGDGFPGFAGTEFICTTSVAGFEYSGGNGGRVENFTINGSGVATSPFMRTEDASPAGGFKKFKSVAVFGGTQDNVTILGVQNDSYYDCSSYNAGRDTLYIDRGAGGLCFYNWEGATATRYGIHIDGLVSGGPFGDHCQQIKFFGGRQEHNNTPGGTSELYLRHVQDLKFYGFVFSGGGNSGAVMDVDMTTCSMIDLREASPSASWTQTTVAIGSNGVTLPTGTINVAATGAAGAVFPTAGRLHILRVATGYTTGDYVDYTGKTGTTFTGCTGGTITLGTGDLIRYVSSPANPGHAGLRVLGSGGQLWVPKECISGDCFILFDTGASYFVFGYDDMIDGSTSGNISVAGVADPDVVIRNRTGAWKTPALLNGWTNVGAGYYPVRYRITADREIEFIGSIHNGTMSGGPPASGVICNVPAGYRSVSPDIYPQIPVIMNGTLGVAILTATGDLQVTEFSAGFATAGTCVDGIKFPVDDPRFPIG